VPGYSYLWALNTARPPHEAEFSALVSKLDYRLPVLAVGSNAAPSQLDSKFARWKAQEPGDAEIPVMKVQLEGFDIVYAGHMALTTGAIPATLLRVPQATVTTMVTWLTRRQLAKMNGTEGLGRCYGLLPVPGTRVRGVARHDGLVPDEVPDPVTVDPVNRRLQCTVGYVALTGYACLGDSAEREELLGLEATEAVDSPLRRCKEGDVLSIVARGLALPEESFLRGDQCEDDALAAKANDYLKEHRRSLRVWGESSIEGVR